MIEFLHSSFFIRHSSIVILNQLQQLPALLLHPAGFFFGIFMVIAKQMQDTVNQQFIKSALHAQAGILRFLSSRIHRYYHIAQKMGGQVGKFALAHGKCDDIRWSLAVKIFLVEGFDLRVIHYKDGNFAVRKVQGA